MRILIRKAFSNYKSIHIREYKKRHILYAQILLYLFYQPFNNTPNILVIIFTQNSIK